MPTSEALITARAPGIARAIREAARGSPVEADFRKPVEQLLDDFAAEVGVPLWTHHEYSLATGSDGLSDIAEADLGLVLIPVQKDTEARERIQQFAQQLLEEGGSLVNLADSVRSESLPDLELTARKSHFSQV